MFLGMIYLLTLIMDPLIFSLKFVPLLNKKINILSRIITWLIVIDMVLLLITAIPRNSSDIVGEDDEDEEVEQEQTGKGKSNKLRKNKKKQSSDGRRGNIQMLKT